MGHRHVSSCNNSTNPRQMMRFCKCEIGKQNRQQSAEMLRFALKAAAILLGLLTTLRLGVSFQIIHPQLALIVGETAGLTLAFAALLRGPQAKAAFSWKSLSVSDWISILFFIISSILGWLGFWGELSQPWVLPFTVGTALAHCLFFWVIMIFFMRLIRSIRHAFGNYGQRRGIDELRHHRTYFRHMIECKTKTSKSRDRFMKRAAKAATRRRGDRVSSRRRYLYKAVDRTLSSYEDSSSWMSAALASGGLFIWAVQNLSPGPLTALTSFSPFLVIPLIYYAKSKIAV